MSTNVSKWVEDVEAPRSQNLPMILVSVSSELESALRVISRDKEVDEGTRKRLSDHLAVEYLPESEDEGQEGPSSCKAVPPSLLATVAPHLRQLWGPGQQLLSMVKGGRIFVPRQVVRHKNKEQQASYEERRKRLLLRQEQREYARMTSNIQRAPRESVRDIQSSFKFQAGMGANMVLAVASAFVISYWGSKFVVGSSKMSHRLVIGLAGAVFILLVEILVFVVRSMRADEALERTRQDAETSHTHVGVPRSATAAQELPLLSTEEESDGLSGLEGRCDRKGRKGPAREAIANKGVLKEGGNMGIVG